MANVKISELPEASAGTVLSTDTIVGVFNGITKKCKLSSINLDVLSDGTNYARIQKIYADAINNGSYGQLYDGIAWDENADTYTRLGRTAGSPNYLEIQNGMRRCLLKADGTVNYYLYPTNSALKEDGVTASVLDGTDGQVMVEIPKFYYSYSYVGTTHSWKISSHKLPGFVLHPLFMSDNTELSVAYVGAFEGVLYDTSISKYVCGNGIESTAATFVASTRTITCTALTAPFENVTVGAKLVITGTTSNNTTVTVASKVSSQSITVSESLTDETASSATIDVQRDYTASTGDKLGSVVGVSPITKITRAQARQLAKNMGTNWQLLDYDMMSAIQLLYLIEYGSFYSQNKIGAGISNVSDWTTYNNIYPIAKTGNSVSVGNGTANTAGSSSCATETSKHLTYRGIENPFGHLWKFVDGFNINNNIAYVCNNPVNYADDTTTNYTNIGTMINSNGYINTLLSIMRGFLPKSMGASSSTKITDYYWQSSSWQVALVGGVSDTGIRAGFFCWHLSASSANSTRNIGARLGFKK